MLQTFQETPNRTPLFSLPTQDDLPYEDNLPMETEQHRLQMELLINTLKPWLNTHGGGYVSGNMFIYFSPAQLYHENVRGPDVFVVLGAANHARKSWVVWDEGQSPDIVIELLSDTTTKTDKKEKKHIYQNQLKAREYYWFNPFNAEDWAGFELKQGIYQPMPVDAQNRLISPNLGLALMRWHGVHEGVEAVWLRWATLQGELLPTPQEAKWAAEQRAKAAVQKAKAAKQKAKAAKQEAKAAKQEAKAAAQGAKTAEQQAAVEAEARRVAEAEVARLTALLAQKNQS